LFIGYCDPKAVFKCDSRKTIIFAKKKCAFLSRDKLLDAALTIVSYRYQQILNPWQGVGCVHAV
jgi:hypothetical protein